MSHTILCFSELNTFGHSFTNFLLSTGRNKQFSPIIVLYLVSVTECDKKKTEPLL